MNVKELLDLYDNWNGLVTINTLVEAKDDERGEWKHVVNKANIQKLVDSFRDTVLMERKVIAFGFHDGELTIRV